MNEEDRSKILPLRKQIGQVLDLVDQLLKENPNMEVLKLVQDSLDQAYYVSVFGKLPERDKNG